MCPSYYIREQSLCGLRRFLDVLTKAWRHIVSACDAIQHDAPCGSRGLLLTGEIHPLLPQVVGTLTFNVGLAGVVTGSPRFIQCSVDALTVGAVRAFCVSPAKTLLKPFRSLSISPSCHPAAFLSLLTVCLSSPTPQAVLVETCAQISSLAFLLIPPPLLS